MLKRSSRFACCGVRLISSLAPTIFAVATGSVKSSIAVIRISGDAVPNMLRAMLPSKNLPAPRRATYTKLFHPNDGSLLDKCVVLWYPKPNSVTGEDYCELHVHGGAAVQTAVMDALRLSNNNLRLAERGEFAKRSFLNGKIDLTEVEGLADLINAETEQQRKQAIRQLDGELSRLYSSWRSELSVCLANLEAYIDFADEEQIDDDVLDRVRTGASKLHDAITSHLNDSRRGERLRTGVKLVIVGAPNGGKSSLLNKLTQRDVAIVSSVPGTTRDVIEVPLNLAGYPVQVVDTAGIRRRPDTGDAESLELEAEGMRRTYRNWRVADLLFVVVDICEFLRQLPAEARLQSITTARLIELLDAHSRNLLSIESEIAKQSASFPSASDYANLDKIFILNKMDLLGDAERQILHALIKDHASSKTKPAITLVSCITHDGFETLLGEIKRSLTRLCGSGELHEPLCLTQTRHRVHLQDCLSCLQAFNDALQRHQVFELADSLYPEHVYVESAEQLRRALRHLGRITGHVSTDELLSVIFSQFCIGK